MKERVCKRCLVSKYLDDFPKREGCIDGIRPICRVCTNARIKEWARSKPGYLADKTKNYKQLHPERVREYARAYRNSNAEKMREKYRRQYANNAEKRASAAMARRAKDRTAYNNQVRARRMQHPEKHRAVAQNRRLREIASGAGITSLQIRRQVENQAGRCYYCRSVLDGFHVDHFIPIARGGRHDDSNIVISCPGCNRSKNVAMTEAFFKRIGIDAVPLGVFA